MRWKKLLFTGFYTGFCPVAPGTAGSLLAMFIYFLEYLVFGEISWVVNLIIVLLMIFPSIRLGDAGEEYFKKKDPQEVVLDEMMGYWISVLFFPFNWKIALIAFFLFRIADIIKPFPADRLQKKKGGLGIMLDDYIAGIYANIIILCILFFSRVAGISFY